MHDMIIWIFVTRLNLHGGIDLAPNKYAFTTKEACERMIKGSTTLRCVPLKLVDL